MSQISRIFTWSRCFILIACLCLLGATTTSGHAQASPAAGGSQYKQLPFGKKYQKISPDKLKQIEREVKRAIEYNGFSTPDQKKIVEDYYKEYFFPLWTIPRDRPSPHSKSSFSNLRKRVEETFKRAKDSQTFNTLLEMTLADLEPLATSPEYSPAVRFNAAYMIGRLDTKLASGRTAPVTYPKALDVLLPLLNNPNENDAARYGALLGVVRHAQFNDTNKHSEIIDALLQQAKTQEVPANRSPESHEWFRTTAIEGLAYAKDAEINKVAPALAEIINSKTETDSLRLAAANSLGRLPLTPTTETNPAVTIRSLGELASKIVQHEVEACEKAPEKTLDPALLMSQLLPIRVALCGSEKYVRSPQGGLAAVAKDKAFLEKVLGLVDDWYKKLDDKRFAPDDAMLPPEGGAVGALPPAQAATEELIKDFKRQLPQMEKLVGGTGSPN